MLIGRVLLLAAAATAACDCAMHVVEPAYCLFAVQLACTAGECVGQRAAVVVTATVPSASGAVPLHVGAGRGSNGGWINNTAYRTTVTSAEELQNNGTVGAVSFAATVPALRLLVEAATAAGSAGAQRVPSGAARLFDLGDCEPPPGEQHRKSLAPGLVVVAAVVSVTLCAAAGRLGLLAWLHVRSPANTRGSPAVTDARYRLMQKMGSTR